MVRVGVLVFGVVPHDPKVIKIRQQRIDLEQAGLGHVILFLGHQRRAGGVLVHLPIKQHVEQVAWPVAFHLADQIIEVFAGHFGYLWVFLAVVVRVFVIRAHHRKAPVARLDPHRLVLVREHDEKHYVLRILGRLALALVTQHVSRDHGFELIAQYRITRENGLVGHDDKLAYQFLRKPRFESLRIVEVLVVEDAQQALDVVANHRFTRALRPGDHQRGRHDFVAELDHVGQPVENPIGPLLIAVADNLGHMLDEQFRVPLLGLDAPAGEQVEHALGAIPVVHVEASPGVALARRAAHPRLAQRGHLHLAIGQFLQDLVVRRHHVNLSRVDFGHLRILMNQRHGVIRQHRLGLEHHHAGIIAGWQDGRVEDTSPARQLHCVPVRVDDGERAIHHAHGTRHVEVIGTLLRVDPATLLGVVVQRRDSCAAGFLGLATAPKVVIEVPVILGRVSLAPRVEDSEALIGVVLALDRETDVLPPILMLRRIDVFEHLLNLIQRRRREFLFVRFGLGVLAVALVPAENLVEQPVGHLGNLVKLDHLVRVVALAKRRHHVAVIGPEVHTIGKTVAVAGDVVTPFEINVHPLAGLAARADL